MRASRGHVAAVAAVVAAALAAAPALGDATISAGPLPDSYASSSVTIDQGQALTFQNGDSTAAHNVTADQTAADDKPLFASQTIASGKTAPVAGVEFLTTGDYPFHCSIHPRLMTGTLHVTANGTPKQRTPLTPSPSTADTTPPDAAVAILDSRISAVLEHRGLRVLLTTTEPSRFRLSATTGKTTLASGIVVVKGSRRHAKLDLTRSGKRVLFRASSVRVTLKARVNDAADNRATAAATRTLR